MRYRLFSYWRSSAAWRVRLALELKELDYVITQVHLLRDGGEQSHAAYTALNPMQLVPSLQFDQHTLTQSTAICEYLDSRHTQQRLLPAEPIAAAKVRAFCAGIACDTHPLNNLRVLQYLEQEMKLEKPARDQWYRHWIGKSFAALESMVDGESFCFNNEISLADCFLIPQIYNARRFDCSMQAYPKLQAIEAHCSQLPAFIAAHPDQQPDKPDHA
ncbi:MAG: maleylacetoacetate isomerase [Oceanococcus sp.]